MAHLHLLKRAQPIACLVVLGACGDDDGQTSSTPSPTPGGIANAAPLINGTPPSEATVGEVYEFVPDATDADEDVLTFAIDNRPDWVAFSPTSGRLSGTPTTSNAGVYENIVISVSDGTVSRSLDAFSITVSPTSIGSVFLSWQAPTKNTDGSTLTDLAGYRVHYGTTPGNYTESLQLAGQAMTSVVIADLPAARWYFAVKAYNSAGLESDFSESVNRVIQ